MTKPNAANERIKHEYFDYLEQAMGRDTATIDGVAKSLARFEESTGARATSNGFTGRRRSRSRRSWPRRSMRGRASG